MGASTVLSFHPTPQMSSVIAVSPHIPSLTPSHSSSSLNPLDSASLHPSINVYSISLSYRDLSATSQSLTIHLTSVVLWIVDLFSLT